MFLKMVTTGLFVTLLSGCATWNWIWGKRDYPLPEGKVAGEVICGEKRCIAGQNGIPFDFIKNPWSPSIQATTTPKEAAMQVVGYTSNNPYGRDPFTCSTDGVSPFRDVDISNLGNSNGRSFVYRETETLDIDVNAAVETDMSSLQSAGLITEAVNLSDIKAKLTAAYSSLDQSVVNITAKYFEFGLNGEAFRDVFERNKYPGCSKIIKEKGEFLITAVGLVWYDLNYESNSTQELISNVEAELKSYGIDYNFGASVRNEVSKNLTATTKNGFQVITWTTADASVFR